MIRRRAIRGRPGRGARIVGWLAGWALTASPVTAQPPAGAVGGGEDEATAAPPAGTGAPPSEAPTLSAYYRAMAEARLLRARGGSLRELRRLVARGEALADDGRHAEAVAVLGEVTEGPRYADFAEDDEFRHAELALAGSLEALGALPSARRVLGRILDRGPEDRWFAPAYRRAVDVVLAAGDLAAAVAWLEGRVPAELLPEDAANELRYLRGRAAYEAGDPTAARQALGAVTRRSRFHAAASYLLGVLEVRSGDLPAAEARFCQVAEIDDTDRFTFFVDDRHFEVRDLAWIALGRVAHEGRRPDDAFYYYFQVPNDSERVAEALFEAAWAMYEGDDHDTALDLLDQLGTRFPASPFVDEAKLLRGYVHLARCEFEPARRLFVDVETTFRPVLAEVDRILASPARQEELADLLLAAAARERAARAEQRRAQLAAARQPERVTPGEADAAVPGNALAAGAGVTAGGGDPLRLVLALLRVDGAFLQLHRDLRTLDAEVARAGRLGVALEAIRGRLAGDEGPRAAVGDDDGAGDGDRGEGTALARRLDQGQALVRATTGQLDALRRAATAGGIASARLDALDDELARASRRLASLEARLRAAVASGSAGEPPGVAEAAPGNDGDAGPRARLDALLRQDAAAALALPPRAAEIRAALVRATGEVAAETLRRLRSRLAENLRKARIGRIDAVMGSKRRIEIQVESLAAGRFPPELFDPLSMQGLLRDDEEYWPYDGEAWADEFDESRPGSPDEPAAAPSPPGAP